MIEATRLSELLFGRACRLPTAIWISNQSDRFYQSQVPLIGTSSRSNVVTELQRLVDLGMLDEERPDGTNRVYYRRRDSPYWDIVATAAAVAGQPPQP